MQFKGRKVRARGSRLRSMGLALAVLAALGVVEATPAAASAPPACPPSAPGYDAAAAAAKACLSRVEVMSARTETARVLANPDGTSTIEQYAYPQRVRRADGSWADLDATLTVNRDGSLSPRASTVDLKLSGGGAGPLLTGRRAGAEVSLSWPDALPAPKVDGASATYPEVFPGVDLVVTAHKTGFSEVLVVKHRLAARNPKLRRLAFGANLSGLSWRNTDGRLEAVDGAGRAVLGATAPRMWDSSSAPAGGDQGGRAKGDHTGPAEGVAGAPIALSRQGDQLTLEPAASMLDDPGAQFPLYLDPTIGYFGWTMINSYYTNQSYWSYDKWNCPSPFTGECAKVGQAYGEPSGMDYRSMWSFSSDAFRGKLITNARFGIDLLYSAYASDSQTDLYRVDSALGSGTTWANTAWAWGTYVTSVWNYSKPAARKYTEFGMTGEIQNIANWNWAWVTYGLKANTESSATGWKKFDAATARLIVDVNTRPNMPDTLTVDGKACPAGSSRPVISTATPVLKGRVTDPDGNSMHSFYAWLKWNGSSFVDAGSGNNAPWASGAFAQITTGTLDHGGIYTFRMQTNDSPSVGMTGYGISDVTHIPGNCEWEVDLQDPAVPGVDPDIYEENNVGCPAAGCGSVGETGRFVFSSSPDVVSYRWGFTSPPTNVLTPTTTGGTVTLDWTPPSGGAKSLFVQAIDRAGRTATKTHQFTVAPPSTAAARWKLDESTGSTELIDDTGNGWTATPYGDPSLGADGRILPGLDGASRSAVDFDGVDDYLTVPGVAMPDTSKSFSLAAWVRLDSAASQATVIEQLGTVAPSYRVEFLPEGWRFAMTSADTAAPTWPLAQSTSPPRVGAWTHLAAVFDSGADTLTIYVNGVAEATAAAPATAWDANGEVRISGNSRWNGALSEVQVWDRVVSAAEVSALVDPINVGLVGEWRMDEVGPGPAYDASGFARDLSFYGGAEIPASGAGQSGTGLRLDGVNDYVSPDLPVLYTDQSFTASVWVRPIVSTGYQNFLTQYSTGTVPGFLMYHGSIEAEWKCKMGASATDGSGTTATLIATPATDTASYHHLVCVFDAQKRELRLYLDGVLKTTRAMNAAWQPWRASGPLVIGHGQHPNGPTGWVHGDVDEVRVYQGVVIDVTRIP